MYKDEVCRNCTKGCNVGVEGFQTWGLSNLRFDLICTEGDLISADCDHCSYTTDKKIVDFSLEKGFEFKASELDIS